MGDRVVLTCSLCERELTPHCAGDNACGWWRCTNRTCAADIFDAERGLLRRSDASVERL